MPNTYYTLTDDGAPFRCKACGTLKQAKQMRWLAPYDVRCTTCLGEVWLKTAKCLGTK